MTEPEWERTDWNASLGSSFQGTIWAKRRSLERIFGPPLCDLRPMGSRVNDATTEWFLLFADGTVATIYDSDVCDPNTGQVWVPGPDDNYEWCIGGYSQRALDLVARCVKSSSVEEFFDPFGDLPGDGAIGGAESLGNDIAEWLRRQLSSRPPDEPHADGDEV